MNINVCINRLNEMYFYVVFKIIKYNKLKNVCKEKCNYLTNNTICKNYYVPTKGVFSNISKGRRSGG